MCEGCTLQAVTHPRANDRALAAGFLAAAEGKPRSSNPHFNNPNTCADSLSTYGWWSYGWDAFRDRIIPYDIWKQLPDGLSEGPLTVAARKLLAEKGELTPALRTVLHY